ncbi:mCG148299 [Mus musculus]|nr:mCG148299 [Mus musculus]
MAIFWFLPALCLCFDAGHFPNSKTPCSTPYVKQRGEKSSSKGTRSSYPKSLGLSPPDCGLTLPSTGNHAAGLQLPQKGGLGAGGNCMWLRKPSSQCRIESNIYLC